jgi:hypothetical protein
MLGQLPTEQEPSLFSYHINLERRVGRDHPLRQIKAALDLSFVVPAVAFVLRSIRQCFD